MSKLVVLDFLSNGHPLDKRPMHLREPLVQAINVQDLVLVELVPAQGFKPNLHEELDGDSKEKIRFFKGRITFDKLTQTARSELAYVVEKIVGENEKRFADFFNKAYPLTTRQHSLELLPGVGKKHMWDIIDGRKEKPFESFQELRDRVKLMPDPKKAIVKRVLEELEEKDKYFLFVQPPIRRDERFNERRRW